MLSSSDHGFRVRRVGSGAATEKLAVQIFEVLCDFLGQLRLGGRRQSQLRQTPPHHLSPIAMFESRDTVNQRDEVSPALPLCSERPSPFRGQAVVTSSALLRLFHPPSNNPSTFLEPVKQRVEGGHVKSQRTS